MRFNSKPSSGVQGTKTNDARSGDRGTDALGRFVFGLPVLEHNGNGKGPRALRLRVESFRGGTASGLLLQHGMRCKLRPMGHC